MLLRRRSVLSGKARTMDLPVTDDELARYRNGEVAQSVWPHLSADDREFIMTGVTPEEWDAAFDGDSYTGEGDYE